MTNLILILQKTMIYATPLLIVALAGCFSERSGIINLALEGEMIFGAFIGALCVNAWQVAGTFVDNQQLMFVLALLISGVAGALFSLLLSFAAIKLKVDQTIAGTALNMLAPAIFLTVCLVFFNQEKLVMNPMPNYVILHKGDMNPLYEIFCNKAYISTYIIFGLFVVLSIWLYKSKIGTHLRACGEHPQAADSVGINVYKMRFLGTTISGFLAGIGGYAYIATVSAGTAEASVGGMGFLALAIMIFGNWNPVGIFFGSLLFGFLKCIGPLAGQISFLNSLGLDIYFYNIIPFVIVIIVLIISRNKSGCPKAEGIPYDKGQR
ncbi:MAG: ABC transporter permease [Solobacterium sp.]|nr:ABC transporter permease [Solobacterium sp.]MDY2952800.1 ABC transporter permease [Erysipelotrichaceae bacterium]MCI6878238.1 ABC transporter permease [Solobacterium sp.]MCI7156712.1 ABC transporter permease [Solobacterium sp.]MCI7446109.1 ABC transporter permease [Solobacterium sp.]